MYPKLSNAPLFSGMLLRVRRAAFTLIELLVVIAIIIILIALLFPALSGFRERINVVTCLHNMQQLATASFTYAGDHDGILPTNYAASNGFSWVVNFSPIGKTGLDGIHNGCLWPYVKEERTYLCPSYPLQSDIPEKHFYRSYSFADYIANDRNYGFNRVMAVKNPSHIVMIAEENPTGYGPSDGRVYINDGWFLASNYADRPATYHMCGASGIGKCNIVFLDGHGETLNGYPGKSKQDQIWPLTYNWQNYVNGARPVTPP